MLSNLAPLFYMLGIVGAAMLLMALIANIAADLRSSKQLKRQQRIWKR